MSDDLIKRSDAIKALNREKSDWNNDYNVPIDNCIKRLNKVKSAGRPQGEWIPCTKSGLPLTELMRREGQKWYGYRCSNCNHIYKGNALTDCNFCPNCGARMKGADDER